jgi:hypothetical protein
MSSGQQRLAKAVVRRFAGSVGTVLAALVGLLCAPTPAGHAQPCPDVEAVFARGTNEPMGVGGTGQAFVDALRWQLGGRTLAVYPVNYAASGDFASPDFPRTVVQGAQDADIHIRNTAGACPNTRIVLGGYSQGAVVADFVASGTAPQGLPPEAVPAPLPPEVTERIAAVVYFGKPTDQVLRKYGATASTTSEPLAAKSLNLCLPGDPICSPGTDGNLHKLYVANGLTNQGAAFAAARLAPPPPPPPPLPA